MMKKLIVSGMSLSTTKEHLLEAFGKFGKLIDVTIETDPVTGLSQGFGYVTFSDTADAHGAMIAMKSRLCWQVLMSR